MAKISDSAIEKDKDLQTNMLDQLPSMVITTSPVVICGVQRKANIGNFENVDIFMGVALPQAHLDMTDPDALSEALNQAADVGFAVTSTATLERYNKVSIYGKDHPSNQEPAAE